jgi:hypothetical protein
MDLKEIKEIKEIKDIDIDIDIESEEKLKEKENNFNKVDKTDNEMLEDNENDDNDDNDDSEDALTSSNINKNAFLPPAQINKYVKSLFINFEKESKIIEIPFKTLKMSHFFVDLINELTQEQLTDVLPDNIFNKEIKEIKEMNIIKDPNTPDPIVITSQMLEIIIAWCDYHGDFEDNDQKYDFFQDKDPDDDEEFREHFMSEKQFEREFMKEFENMEKIGMPDVKPGDLNSNLSDIDKKLFNYNPNFIDLPEDKIEEYLDYLINLWKCADLLNISRFCKIIRFPVSEVYDSITEKYSDIGDKIYEEVIYNEDGSVKETNMTFGYYEEHKINIDGEIQTKMIIVPGDKALQLTRKLLGVRHDFSPQEWSEVITEDKAIKDYLKTREKK